jgi:O-antigen biosynthesis protein
MIIDVVVPVYNGGSYIVDCLSSLTAQTHQPRQIIVVDDHSSDHSVRLVRESGMPVRLLEQPVNYGFAHTVNQGMALTSGADSVLLLNQDVVLDPDFIQVVATTLASTQAGIVGARLTYPDRIRIQHAGGWINWPSAEAHHYTSNAPPTHSESALTFPDFVTGAAMAISRATIERIGNFDEQISRAYYEDVDFCYRARAAGISVVYQPAAQGIHSEGSALRHDSYRQAWSYHCGRIGFLLKHGDAEQINAGITHEELACSVVSNADDYLARTRAYLYQAARATDIWHKRQAIYPDRASSETYDGWRSAQERLLALAEKYVEQAFKPLRSHAQSLLSDCPPAALQEYRFHSNIPVIGPAVARLRNAVHNLAGRWAIHHIVEQQSRVNDHTQQMLANIHRQIANAYRVEEDTIRRLFDMARRIQELEAQAISTNHAKRDPSHQSGS